MKQKKPKSTLLASKMKKNIGVKALHEPNNLKQKTNKKQTKNKQKTSNNKHMNKVV